MRDHSHLFDQTVVSKDSKLKNRYRWLLRGKTAVTQVECLSWTYAHQILQATATISRGFNALSCTGSCCLLSNQKWRREIKKKEGRGNTIIAPLLSTQYFSKANQRHTYLVVDRGPSLRFEILKAILHVLYSGSSALTRVTDIQEWQVCNPSQPKLLMNINRSLAVVRLTLLHGHFCYGYTLRSDWATQSRQMGESRAPGLVWNMRSPGKTGVLLRVRRAGLQTKGELHRNRH